MDENNVVTNEQAVDQQPDTQQAEPVKPEKTDSAEVEKLKRLLSKANAEASNYKQQLREKQTETERAEAERAEQEQAMREELKTLRHEKAVSDYTGRCMALNFDADLAAKFATAYADGDADAVFDCLKAFVDATTTRLSNEALNRQPGLSAGTPPTTNTVDKDIEDMRRWMWGNSSPRK